LSSHAFAAVESPVFTDPEQQNRYQRIITELRCLVCQNQTIADSNAELAQDLRRQVREMLQQGQSESQITAFMTARYGEFVRYKPAFSSKTALLWLGPGLLLLLGGYVIAVMIKRQKTTQSTALSEADHRSFTTLLEKGEGND
jgi:cytochrome c-type biogenesis protein CcmH